MLQALLWQKNWLLPRKWKWKSLSCVLFFVTPWSPWNSPGKNTGVDSHSLHEGIFPTQGSNPGLPHCRWILYRLSHQGSSRNDMLHSDWVLRLVWNNCRPGDVLWMLIVQFSKQNLMLAISYEKSFQSLSTHFSSSYPVWAGASLSPVLVKVEPRRLLWSLRVCW